MNQEMLDIVDKVMKLMELGNSDKNGNPHERESANKKAAELMAKWGIDYVDLKNNKPKDDTFITLDVDGSSEQKVDYEAALAYAIAKAFDCKIVNTFKWGSGDQAFTRIWRLCFLGSKHDVEIVVYFFKFLRRTLGTMAIKSVTKESIKEANPYLGRKVTAAYVEQARRNYCFGMVNTIDERLQELYMKREEFIPSDCKAVMVVKKDAVEQFMRDKFPNLRYGRAVSLKGDMASFHKGKADGQRVNLSRPIDNNHGTPATQLGG
jgi:hypothetical protein